MKILVFLLLLLPLSAFGHGGMLLHTGDCQQKYVEKVVVKLAVLTMGLSHLAMDNTLVFCDPSTPTSNGVTYQQLAASAVGCTDTRYWTYLIGCAWANASGYTPPGWIAVLRMHPSAAHRMLDRAQAQGMSFGSRSREEIVCLLGSLDRFAKLVIHELMHVWFGYRHGPEMNAEEQRLHRRYRVLYGAWTDANEWDCRQPRILIYEPVTERVTN